MPITLDNKIGFLSRVVESTLKKKKILKVIEFSQHSIKYYDHLKQKKKKHIPTNENIK